jgi:hypothetical protein
MTKTIFSIADFITVRGILILDLDQKSEHYPSLLISFIFVLSYEGLVHYYLKYHRDTPLLELINQLS